MDRDFFYLCLAFSLLLHLSVGAFVKFDGPPKDEEKEKPPLVVDVVGPLKQGPVTKLPKTPAAPEDALTGPRYQERAVSPPSGPASSPQVVAKAQPQRPAPAVPAPQAKMVPQAKMAPQARVAPLDDMPPLPVPQPSRDAAPGQEQADAPKEQPAPQPAPQSGGGATSFSLAKAVVPDATREATRPKKLIQPSAEELMRYAELGKETQRSDDNSITLDTNDLLYTSYLDGLRKRIELIWQYPETARRDGIQGDLVMKFSIEKSGRVSNVQLIRSSGYAMLDEAARKALYDANPFNPLPSSWKKEQFTITGTFTYSLYGVYIR